MTYQLSEFQFNTLKKAATPGNSRAFAVVDAMPTDSEKIQTETYNDLKECRDLIGLELLEDVTEKFKPSVELSKLNHNGRGFSVFCLTDLAIMMFGEERVAN